MRPWFMATPWVPPMGELNASDAWTRPVASAFRIPVVGSMGQRTMGADARSKASPVLFSISAVTRAGWDPLRSREAAEMQGRSGTFS
ncbi:hypothetical protein EES37_35045 [Streptomyces sp. ADI91-18]|nr:hypothetical protein EES37_35045 [Streptomyces sp. ADI91-18]